MEKETYNYNAHKKNTGRSSHGKKKSNNIYMAELKTLESYLKMKIPQLSASPV